MEKVNILLVDDQQRKLLTYEAMLSQLGENLVFARSGREALQLLLKQEFALILLDVVMPDMDGFETASLIRQHPRLKQTPIIFVTAFSLSDMDHLRGYELGAVDYVFVPVVPEILHTKVAVFVELYRKRQELENLNNTLETRVAQRTAELEEASAELAEMNMQLESEIEDRKRAEEELRLLQTLTMAISQAEDLNAALEVVLQKVCNVTGWVLGEVWIPNVEYSALECSRAWYCTDPDLYQFREGSLALTFKPGIGLPGQVWSSQKMVRMPDVTVDERFRRRKAARRANLKCGMGFPVLAGDTVVAVIVFFVRHAYNEDVRPIQLVSSAAAQLGVIIQRKQAEEAVHELNANLERRVVERTAQLKEANEVLHNEIAQRMKTEAKFRGLLEAAPDAMVIVDEDFHIVLINSQTEKLFGYRRDELFGKPVELLVPKRFQERHLSHRTVYLNNPRTRPMGAELNLYGLRKDGSEFPVEISLSPLEREEGFLIISAIRDITDRKRAEEERAKLAAIVESSEDAIISMTLDGFITSWNPGAEKTYGYTAAEAKGKDVSIIASPDDLKELFDSVEKIVGGEQVATYEAKRVTKDGREIDVFVSLSAIKDVTGKITAISKISRDITERKHSEEALSSQTRILHSILVSMADAVIVVDAEGKLLLFNPAAEQIQSFDSTDGKNNEGTEQNEYGLYLPDMVTPYPKDDLPLNRVLHGEAPEENEMFVRVPKAPVGIWLSTIARPLKDENGVLQGGVAVLRDITAGKIAEQELRKSREQLRNLSAHLQSIREQERARMAREIHDQLGQTLTALKMDLSWLVKRLSNGKKALLERTLAMNEIIDMTIQTVQRISAELRPGLLDDLGLSAAVEWQTEQFRERSEIDCTINLSPEHIVVDRECSTEMFRIFQEILTNIARHANATQVKIDLIKREKKLVLKVRDNGEGITKSEISDSQSLGLIGMRERVYPWGGRVRIAGVPDRGTIVCVTMPLQSQRLQFTDLTSV